MKGHDGEKPHTEKRLVLFIGPPKNKEDDRKAVELFKDLEGTHFVCGGVSALIVSSYLGMVHEVDPSYTEEGMLPYGKIGDDITVTEGVVTLCFVEEYYQGKRRMPGMSSGAGRLIDAFDSHSDITIILGCAIGAYNGGLPSFMRKYNAVYSIKEHLESLGKRVTVIEFK